MFSKGCRIPRISLLCLGLLGALAVRSRDLIASVCAWLPCFGAFSHLQLFSRDRVSPTVVTVTYYFLTLVRSLRE